MACTTLCTGVASVQWALNAIRTQDRTEFRVTGTFSTAAGTRGIDDLAGDGLGLVGVGQVRDDGASEDPAVRRDRRRPDEWRSLPRAPMLPNSR